MQSDYLTFTVASLMSCWKQACWP